MRASEDVFQLIKSMTGPEKRYFKLFSSIYERDKNYLKLFEAIDKQRNTYNEAKLFEEFKNELWLNQLPKTKNQLYEVLLECLSVFHRNRDIHTQLLANLSQIKILFEKRLFEQSKKLVFKAKKLAVKYDYHWELIKLVEWELKINQFELYAHSTKEELRALYNNMYISIDRMKNEFNYSCISMNFFVVINKSGSIRRKVEMKKYESAFNNGLMESTEKALSFHALSLFYQLKSHYYFYNNNFDKSLKFRQEIRQLYDLNPHQIEENIDKYAANLFNIASNLSNIKQFDQVHVIAKVLRSVHITSGSKRQEMYFDSLLIDIEAYLAVGDFDKGVPIVKELENNLQIVDKYLDTRLQIAVRANIAKLYFGFNNFTKANFWFNNIFNNFKADVKPDSLCITRIIQLIVYFEMNDVNLDYAVKSTYRYILKHKRLYKFEDAVLMFIRKKIPKLHSNKDLVLALQALKTEIEKIFIDPYERKVLSYFDFISWLESKIANRTFAEIVRKNAVKTLSSS